MALVCGDACLFRFAQELLADLRRAAEPEEPVVPVAQLLATTEHLLQLPLASRKEPDLVVAVAVLGQRNLWQEAIQQLRRERPAGLRPNVICYNAAAGACNRAAAWFSALEVLGDAAQLGLQLDSASVNLVCSAYEKGSCWRFALTSLSNWRSAGVWAYNAAMSSGVASSSWQRSSALLQVMVRSSLEPSMVSLTATVALPDAVEAGCWLLALRLFTDLHRWQVQADSAAGNAAMTCGSWLHAVALGEEVSQKSLDLSLRGHNAIIHAAGQGRWQMAIWSLGRLGSRDVISFNSAITAAEASAQWPRAMQLLEEICGLSKPTSISFNSVMSAAGAGQRWREVLHFRKTTEILQLHGDVIGFATLLGAFQHSLDWDNANFFLAEARHKRISTTTSGHNAALMACQQKWLAALDLLSRMKGVRSDDITFAAAAVSCQEASQWQEVVALRLRSWAGGAEMGLLLQNAAHSAWRQARRWQSSVQLLQEMQEENLLPDMVSFAETVETCEMGGQPGPAAIILNLCNSRAWLP
ncbi:Pentatricopeptide repeat-containing protein At2g31400 [Durusdinium trenchii]|uniref:Chloroplastic n=1 Tax=Durusdinium trenchii TaxID=1381693 RepID=A0ABP0IVP4_9DINO